MADALTGRRGQPLVALCLIVMVWGGARTAMWRGGALLQEMPAKAQTLGALPLLVPGGGRIKSQVLSASVAAPDRGAPIARTRAAQHQHREGGAGALEWQSDVAMLVPASLLRQVNPALAAPRTSERAAQAVVEPDAALSAIPIKDDPRWSGDNWLLMRAGSGAAAQAPGAASYGASQAGAVVRYRLGRGDLHESYGYLRTSLAINAPGRDKEVALGFGFRPISRVPLRVLAEARLQDSKGSAMQVRPVATVVTELAAQRLPLGLTAEAYGQAGYAGGRGATAFYDVQAVVERVLPGVGGRNRDLRLGAGVWSGGQEGAVRLDMGPRTSFRLDLGDANPARVALDWRFRVAGNARPGSGPALTIASSF
ncbi:MAG: hypothetical protein ACOVQ0_13490 [Novosphingobium sp.]|uniref:hypothetical protein n=1 Tax=Novosphingobium sp. TaxID=1874826 RepID=UPI003B9B198B